MHEEISALTAFEKRLMTAEEERDRLRRERDEALGKNQILEIEVNASSHRQHMAE